MGKLRKAFLISLLSISILGISFISSKPLYLKAEETSSVLTSSETSVSTSSETSSEASSASASSNGGNAFEQFMEFGNTPLPYVGISAFVLVAFVIKFVAPTGVKGLKNRVSLLEKDGETENSRIMDLKNTVDKNEMKNEARWAEVNSKVDLLISVNRNKKVAGSSKKKEGNE